MNKIAIFVLVILMLLANLFLSFVLLRQNKELKMANMSIDILGNASSENNYLKNVIGEFYLKEGRYRNDIYGLRDGITEQKLSEILLDRDSEYSLILEAEMGDCSQCVDSILNLLGKTPLKENLIFISSFQNYGSLQFIKKENDLQNSVFFNTIVERNSVGSPELYLIDKQLKTTNHCLVDYKNMRLAGAYLRTMEERFFQ